MNQEGEGALKKLLGNTVESVRGRPGGDSAVVILEVSQGQLEPIGNALAERTEALEAQRANAEKAALVVRQHTEQKTEQLRAELSLRQQQEAIADHSIQVQHQAIERKLQQRDIDGYNLVEARNEKKNGPGKSNQQAHADYKRNMAARKRARTSGGAPHSSGAGTTGGAQRQKTLKGSGAAFGKFFNGKKTVVPGPYGPTVTTEWDHDALSGPAQAG